MKLNVITSDVVNRVHSSKVTWGKPFGWVTASGARGRRPSRSPRLGPARR
jgi:hypothetical protein